MLNVQCPYLPLGSNIAACRQGITSTKRASYPEDVGAVRNEGPSTADPSPYLRRRKTVTVILAFAAIAVVAVFVMISSRRHPPRESNAVRLSLGLPHGITLHRSWHPFEYIALSPDGEMLAFAASDASGQSSLWVRELSSSEPRKMEQTEGALLPFWSPDSQFIGFWAGGKLQKIGRLGGTPEVIFSVAEVAQGTWGPDGTILFARTVNSPIFRVSADGAKATPVTSLLPGQVSQMWVQFLPDGKQIIYLARTSLAAEDPHARVYAQRLDGDVPREILTTQHRPVVAGEYLLFIQQQNLYAQRMEWNSLGKMGEPLLVARNVAASPAYLGSSDLAASQNGVLIYGTAEQSPGRSTQVVCTRWRNGWRHGSGGRLSAVHAFSRWQAPGTELIPTACYRQSVAN